MPTQLALSFDAVPVTCEVQQRYHSIAPCLAGISTPAGQAQALNLGYSNITRWLREFRTPSSFRIGMVRMRAARPYRTSSPEIKDYYLTARLRERGGFTIHCFQQPVGGGGADRNLFHFVPGTRPLWRG